MKIEQRALNFLRRRKLKELVDSCLMSAAGREILVKLCLQDRELDRFFKAFVTRTLGTPKGTGFRNFITQAFPGMTKWQSF
jgi:hypothetical protein